MKNGKQFLSLLLVMCLVVGLSNNLTLAAPTVGDQYETTDEGILREVTFQYTDASATSVCVVGDFNNWNKDDNDWQMQKNDAGTWELTKEISEGEYRYAFSMDGKGWTKDPNNCRLSDDSYYSLLVVPGEVTSPVVDGNSVTINFPKSRVPNGVNKVKVRGKFFNEKYVEFVMKLDSSGKHYTVTIKNVKVGDSYYRIKFYRNSKTSSSLDWYNMKISPKQQNSEVTVKDYTVSFNANGGTGSMAYVPNTVGDYTLPECGFTAPDGKRFKGWSDKSDGSEPISSGSNYFVNKDTTLYAMWEDDTNKAYTISFNANNGTGNMANVDVNKGNYKLPSCTFTPPAGKRFKAWALNSVAGSQYNEDEDYTVDSDVTFYAVWEDITHTVTFIGNGGPGSMGNVTANEGSYILPNSTFTKPDGKQFKGWSETIDGSGTVYNQGATFNLTKDTTLYAIWENDPPTTFQVSFDANGGSGNMVPVEKNGAYILPDNGFVAPAGKRFKAWALNSTSGTQYNAGDNYTVGSNVTFYAVWEDITYTVTYDKNDGSEETTVKDDVKVADYKTPNNTFTPPYGKQFKCWSETSDASGTVYNQGVAVTLTEDTTLYAIWEDEPALNRTISFNANGGSGFMNNDNATDGLNYTIPSNGFTRDGYKFKEWAEGSENGDRYAEGDSYTVNGNTTFYAIWEKLSTPSVRMEFISNEALEEVPEGLKNTEFNTIEKIKNVLISAVTQNSEYTDENTTTYDVKMQISSDGGTTWVEATEADFPTEGITVKLPYPQGTGKNSHDFAVAHMFTTTSARLGTVAGETETPEVTKLDDGIQVTLKGLSPVSIAWKPVTTTSDSETSEETKNPDNTTPSDSGTSEETKTPDDITPSDSETSEEEKNSADTTTSDVQNNSNVSETQSALATSTDSDEAKDVKSDNSIDVLETGDNRIISLYIGTMIASLIGFISIVTIRKKKRDKKDLTK